LHGNWPQRAGDPDRRVLLAAQDAAGAWHNHRPLPVGGIDRRRRPAGTLQAGVIGLAIAQGVEDDRPGSRPPGGIADDGLLTAIAPGQVELAEELGAVAPGSLLEVPDLGRRAIVPPVAEHDAEDIGAGPDLAGHV